ncbi:glycosyltransferase family 2 protein [Microbispora triticiradicis]|uniref:glycosyltransferase family 2 protein n=1 Tax=Microbispora triticiradicis TaxID=2200763 RepID=UPI001AD7AD08|nr:glycosyltransferase family 2 protein [Microbispora triticiradicis]MBO4275114.1 glycosyltransferase [Microbispora triticiradicis]
MTPRIRGNDYTVLEPPALGSAWTPSLRASVVIPAYGAQAKLDLTLAGLAAQTYPADLLEVIVVDNGSDPPLRLPEIRPRGTRLLVCEAPGRARARNAGLAAATGDVIHWMDSDVVPEREEVEAHMRWHHLAPYLSVTSYLRFSTAALPAPEEVAGTDDLAKLFEPAEPHAWIEDLVERSQGLTRSPRPFSIHIGGASSANVRLFERAGAMDPEMILGQDTEMGYRLAQAGAVFIPDPQARAYHLGPSMRMRDSERINRVSHALVTDRVPGYRWLRTHPSRQWKVPQVEVVVDATAGSYDEVRATVDGVLAGTVTDLAVVLTGPWDELAPEQRAPLKDPRLDLVLLRAHYAHEGRVRLATTPPDTTSPYRLRVPPGWSPGEDTLGRLLEVLRGRERGLVSVLLAEDAEGIVAARLERTEAFARAALIAAEGENADDLVDEMFGTYWVDGESFGFAAFGEAAPYLNPRAAYRARVSAQAEVERLNKEVERLRGQVAKWREEAGRWRRSAVEFRREIGALRKEISALRRAQGQSQGQGLRGIARGLSRPFTFKKS